MPRASVLSLTSSPLTFSRLTGSPLRVLKKPPFTAATACCRAAIASTRSASITSSFDSPTERLTRSGSRRRRCTAIGPAPSTRDGSVDLKRSMPGAIRVGAPSQEACARASVAQRSAPTNPPTNRFNLSTLPAPLFHKLYARRTRRERRTRKIRGSGKAAGKRTSTKIFRGFPVTSAPSVPSVRRVSYRCSLDGDARDLRAFQDLIDYIQSCDHPPEHGVIVIEPRHVHEV